MFLKLSFVSTLLLIQSQTNSKTVHSRRKRFVSMWDYWGGETSGEFAVPERIVKFVKPGSPYEDKVKSTGYLGRPSPMMAKFLNWDHTYEELGPTFSTMLGLTQVKENISTILHIYDLQQDLLEHSDVFQSLVARNLGQDGYIYDGSDQRKR